MLIVALAAGLLTQFFPCCAFAIRSFSKVSATPDILGLPIVVPFKRSQDFNTAILGGPCAPFATF